jgi:hypothetical protein
MRHGRTLQLPFDPAGHACDGRVLEQRSHRDRDSEYLREHLEAEKRVAARLEEMLVDSDFLDPEDLAQDAGDDLLPRVACHADGTER